MDMKQIEQSEKLKYVKYDIRGKVSEEAERMSRAGISIVKLNTGNPAAFGFYAPKKVNDAVIKNIEKAQAYTVSQGQYDAREVIAKYAKEKQIPDVGIEDIIIGNGASELIVMAMQALINTGDEVLIPTPDYPLWTSAVYFAGGNPVHYMCDEQAEWNPDIDDIKRKVNSSTKAIVLINPNNPTGALYSKDVLLQIVEIARKNNLIIFSDEIYDRVIFDNLKHVSTASLAPDLLVVTFNGLSKSHKLCGYRSGWMCFSGEKEKTRGFIDGVKLLASIRLCSTVLGQAVIPAAFECNKESQEWLQPDGKLYQQKEIIYKGMNEIPGVSAVKPKAGLYIFPKIDPKKYRIDDDEQFVLEFLKQHHILLTHGGAYNWKGTDHFRIVYLPSADVLSTIAQKLEIFLKGYKI